jgi:TolB-like protein/DNA-binding winged helix-turn-helix (wHTH) protein/Tfp pilus assembly protein PilF
MEERLLLRDGVRVPLTPKVFEILCVLVRRAGHLVSKEELIREVWADSFVEEVNLARNIHLLRKILGAKGDDQAYIQTVPRSGYRFVAHVEAVQGDRQGLEVVHWSSTDRAETAHVPPPSDEASSAQDTSRETYYPRKSKGHIYLFLAAFLILLTASIIFLYFTFRNRNPGMSAGARSLAVLPFKSIDNQSGGEQIGFGLADAILIKLSKLHDMSVIPTTAVLQYGGRGRDPVAAGRELGVDVVLDGTMQQYDGRIRVTAQLVSVADGRTLWADKFDEPQTEQFSLQDSVSAQVARAVAMRLRGVAPEELIQRYSDIAEANQSYLMGFHFWNTKKSKESLSKAIPHLQRAVELDTGFALAHALLADCYFIDGYYGYGILPAGISLERARAESRRAVELNGNLAEAHIVLANIRAELDGDYPGAELEYKRGLEISPNNVTGHIKYGFELFYSLRLEEAVGEIKRAQELEPASPFANSSLCLMMVAMRDYNSAIKYGRRAIELELASPMGHVNLGEAYLHQGMYKEAVAEFSQLSRTYPILAKQRLAYAYASGGKRMRALSMLTELRRQPGNWNASPFDIAAIYAALGEREEAFRFLGRVEWNRVKIALLHYDPQWDKLRLDPRFEELLRRL